MDEISLIHTDVYLKIIIIKKCLISQNKIFLTLCSSSMNPLRVVDPLLRPLVLTAYGGRVTGTARLYVLILTLGRRISTLKSLLIQNVWLLPLLQHLTFLSSTLSFIRQEEKYIYTNILKEYSAVYKLPFIIIEDCPHWQVMWPRSHGEPYHSVFTTWFVQRQCSCPRHPAPRVAALQPWFPVTWGGSLQPFTEHEEPGGVINLSTLTWSHPSLPSVWCIKMNRTQRWSFSLAFQLMNKTSAQVGGRIESFNTFKGRCGYRLWSTECKTRQKVF